jgi:hypothetical protein
MAGVTGATFPNRQQARRNWQGMIVRFVDNPDIPVYNSRYLWNTGKE